MEGDRKKLQTGRSCAKVQNRDFLSHDEQFGPPLFLPFYRDIVPEKINVQNMKELRGIGQSTHFLYYTQMALYVV
jgi:hypothetical protein